MPAPDLPDYAASLTQYHRAFGRELRRAVRAVPLPAGARVLDVPCGDGFYAAALARRLYPFGKVVAADLSDAYLGLARAEVGRWGRLATVEFARADAYALPFAADEFHAVWCARSLISLDRPVDALREMRRVVRPGGVVAVLEDDEYHRVVVNWPVGLELELQRAVAEASRERYGSRAGLSPARRVRRWLLEAGLRPGRRRTFSADRPAPFDGPTRAYLELHLKETREFVAKFLPADQLAALDRAVDPADAGSVFRRPDAELTCLTTLFLATKG
ncbi:MAG: methyltransferase domain-containing protein [Gemmataceae bacterium]|nr:methyltransferase domain-containing protein [Gemmataceae bacterium]